MRPVANSTFLVIFTFFVIIGCARNPESTSLLREVGRLVDLKPDSALLILESIESPEKLSEQEQMEYQLRLVQLRYKNYIPISEDTTIFDVTNYFGLNEKEKWELLFLSHFYSGCVYRERLQYDLTVEEYKRALHIAEKYEDDSKQAFVLYNIGNLYFDRRSFEESLKYYVLAVEKYDGRYEEQMISLHAAAQASLLCDKIDDALVFFDRGLNLAKNQKDSVQEANFLHDKAIVLYNQKNYEKALSLLLQAKDLEPDTTQFARYYLNLADIYSAVGRKDSSMLYTRKLQESIDDFSDVYFQISANKFLADVFATNGDYHMATQYLKAQNDKLVQMLEEENVKAIAEAERRYNLSIKETQLAKEKVRNYQLSLIVSITAWILLLLAGAGSYYFKKHQREKEKNLQLQYETKKNSYLSQVYQNCLGNVSLFKSSVNALAISYAQKDKKETLAAGYAKIEKAIEDMEESIRSGYAPFVTDFLRFQNLMKDEQLEMLKPEDQLLVTLLYAKHEHTKIASLLQINSHALSARKNRLKDKLIKSGLSEKQISIIFDPQ